MDNHLAHTYRIEALLRAGMVEEARRLHIKHVDEQLELAKSQPIDLSDLIASDEQFAIHRIEHEEKDQP